VLDGPGYFHWRMLEVVNKKSKSIRFEKISIRINCKCNKLINSDVMSGLENVI